MKRLDKIIQILNKRYKVKPYRAKPFKILIGTVLSHRTKDEHTWPANERLFKIADTPDKILKLSEKQIIKQIKPVGFYNVKAKRIKQICKMLLEKYNGKVPNAREELMKLPGVGFKTSDLVLSIGFGVPVIGIDTHVNVVSKRLGFADEKDNVEIVRAKLHKLVPDDRRLIVNHLFVQFGKDICTSPRPKCYMCPIEKLCPYPDKNLGLSN